MTLVFASGCNFSMALMIFHALFLGCFEFSPSLTVQQTGKKSPRLSLEPLRR
jgi:hypothetical protein